MKYKEGDTVYLKRDKAVISQLYKSTTGEEGYILVKNDDNNHLYFAKEDEVELIEPTNAIEKIKEINILFYSDKELKNCQAISTIVNKLNEVIRYINKGE